MCREVEYQNSPPLSLYKTNLGIQRHLVYLSAQLKLTPVWLISFWRQSACLGYASKFYSPVYNFWPIYCNDWARYISAEGTSFSSLSTRTNFAFVSWTKVWRLKAKVWSTAPSMSYSSIDFSRLEAIRKPPWVVEASSINPLVKFVTVSWGIWSHFSTKSLA